MKLKKKTFIEPFEEIKVMTRQLMNHSLYSKKRLTWTVLQSGKSWKHLKDEYLNSFGPIGTYRSQPILKYAHWSRFALECAFDDFFSYRWRIQTVFCLENTPPVGVNTLLTIKNATCDQRFILFLADFASFTSFSATISSSVVKYFFFQFTI